MEDIEAYVLRQLAAFKKTGKGEPFMMVEGGGKESKVRLTIKSKVEPVATFGDWVVITLTPEDFVQMRDILDLIIKDRVKEHKQGK